MAFLECPSFFSPGCLEGRRQVSVGRGEVPRRDEPTGAARTKVRPTVQKDQPGSWKSLLIFGLG